MSQVLDSAVFPGTQGGPLMHVIAAKAVALEEALDPKFTEYAIQIQKNAKAMAEELIKRDYNIISGGTDNHLMLIDLTNKNISGRDAEKTLEEAGITLNKNMIPFDEKSPIVTSGIRIGTSAITTRGLKEKEVTKIIDFVDQALLSKNKPKILYSIKQEVRKFISAFPLFSYHEN